MSATPMPVIVGVQSNPEWGIARTIISLFAPQ